FYAAFLDKNTGKLIGGNEAYSMVEFDYIGGGDRKEGKSNDLVKVMQSKWTKSWMPKLGNSIKVWE
ncbi:MAG TPA: hypothetical protein DEG92_01625, partial [Rikenellaceae bacterium]|nr:hypothetical protein [Rikenellaceae bacterium]